MQAVVSMSLSRRLIILVLVIVSFSIVIAQVVSALPVVPAVIDTQVVDATIFIETSDSVLFTGNECTTLRWRVEGIQAVEVDGIPVVGEGSQESCERTVKVLVTFVDGEAREFRLEKSVLFESRLNRILFVGAVAGIGVAFFLTGLPTKIVSFAHSLFPRALRARLQVENARRGVTKPWMILVIIILCATALRMTYLSQPLRYDEAWTYEDFASQPLSIGMSNYYTTNNHLFHTLLAHVSTSIFGGYPWALRLPAFFAGILIVPAAYALGRRYFSLSSALLAAAFTAGSMHLIEYSVNARGYTLISLALLLLLLVADHWIERRTLRRSCAFVILAVLGMYAIPTFIYGLVMVVGWIFFMVLLQFEGKQRWLAVRQLVLMLTTMVLLTALLYLPPLMNLISLGSSNNQMAHMEARGIGDVMSNVLTVGLLAWKRWNLDMPVWLSIALLVGFFVSIVFQGVWGRLRLSPILVALVTLPPLLFLMANANYVRLWVFYLPVYLVLATGGIGGFIQLALPHLRKQTPFIGLASLVVTLVLGVNVLASDSVVTGLETGLMNYSEEAVLTAKQNARQGDLIICDGFCQAVRIYAAIHGVEIAPFQPVSDVSGQSVFLIMSSFKADPGDAAAGRSLKMSLDYIMPDAYEHSTANHLLETETIDVYEIIR